MKRHPASCAIISIMPTNKKQLQGFFVAVKVPEIFQFDTTADRNAFINDLETLKATENGDLNYMVSGS